MKRIIAVCLFILSSMSFCSMAQNETISSDSIINELNMKGIMKEEWYTLDTTWTKNIFPACLMEDHKKLSCGECPSISMTVQLKIDSVGKLVSYKKIKENMCGETFAVLLEKCFLDFFFFIEFPADFRNKTIEVRIGNGLKC